MRWVDPSHPLLGGVHDGQKTSPALNFKRIRTNRGAEAYSVAYHTIAEPLQHGRVRRKTLCNPPIRMMEPHAEGFGNRAKNSFKVKGFSKNGMPFFCKKRRVS